MNIVNKEYSLSKKLFKNINATILFFYLIMTGSISTLIYTSVHQFFEKQINSWISEMPHYVLPSLIDSDSFGIENEAHLLGASGLFSDFLITDNQKNIIAKYSSNKNSNRNSDLNYIPIKDKAGNTWGYYAYAPNFKDFIVPFIWLGLILFLIFMFTYFLISTKLKKYLTIEFKKFSDFLDKLDIYSKKIAELKTLPEEFMQDNTNSEEYNKISKVISHLVEEIKQSHEKLASATVNIEKRKAVIEIGEMSAQLAHDIRSPLAALNVVVKQTQNIPENQRIMIRNAAKQINKIANNLLEKYRGENSEQQSNNPEMIALLLDTVVSEKLAQYSDAKIKIEFDVDPDSHGVFCNIIAVDFKRVISNLINNAVEAMHNQGNVSIRLTHQENLVKISIADSGTGMPQALIQKIMAGEVVSSKKSGHGIGLSTAKTMIESWGGNLNITSEQGKGTNIEINLPLIDPAYWFADNLYFKQNSTIIILDDDQSIHDVWESRFETEIPSANLTRTHYYSPEEALKAEVDQNAVYLCDYELLGHSLTGLDVIEKLNLKNAVLVTSRYDEPDVRARCQKIGIKILPKSYAIYAPLIVQEEQILSNSTATKDVMSLHQKAPLKPDLILIDDNKTLTDAWKLSAEFADKNIVIFNSIGEAESDIHNYSHESVIYVDSDLGESIKGEAYAKTLYDKGYKNLYLATGYEASQFNLEKLYWIKNIVGKEPQFEDI